MPHLVPNSSVLTQGGAPMVSYGNHLRETEHALRNAGVGWVDLN